MLPREYDAGILFGSIPEGLMNQWYEDDPEAAMAAMTIFWQTSLPSILPPAVKETVEQAANFDFFRLRPIVPERMINAPKEQQYTVYTTRAAIAVGKLVGQSPARIEHMVTGMGGAVWLDLARFFDRGVRKEEDQGWIPSNTPILSRMFQRGGAMGFRPRDVTKVYELQQEAIERMSDRFTPETPAERQQRLMISDAAMSISNLSAIKSLSDSEKQRRALTMEQLSIAKDALAQWEKGSVKRGKLQRKKRVTTRRRDKAEAEALE